MTLKEFTVTCIDRAEAKAESDPLEAIRLLELAQDEITKLIERLTVKSDAQ